MNKKKHGGHNKGTLMLTVQTFKLFYIFLSQLGKQVLCSIK
jgi:hypothetical protein